MDTQLTKRVSWIKELCHNMAIIEKFVTFLLLRPEAYFWCDEFENDKFESNKFILCSKDGGASKVKYWMQKL